MGGNGGRERTEEKATRCPLNRSSSRCSTEGAARVGPGPREAPAGQDFPSKCQQLPLQLCQTLVWSGGEVALCVDRQREKDGMNVLHHPSSAVHTLRLHRWPIGPNVLVSGDSTESAMAPLCANSCKAVAGVSRTELLVSGRE